MTRADSSDQQTAFHCTRKTISLVLVLCAGFAHQGSAVETIISFAPEPVGSGARALGQSAFVAVADDATAASWNPAGLTNLESAEASLVGIGRTIANDVTSPASNAALFGDRWTVTEINFMSYALPIAFGNRDVVLSANYHQVYDLAQELSYRVTEPDGDTTLTSVGSEGAISAYSFAGAFSFPSRPEVTLGVSFNWYAESLLDDHARRTKRVDWVVTDVPNYYSTTTEILDDFQGYNFTFGLLWDAYEREENLLTLGFVCHTPFTAKMNQEVYTDLHTGSRVPSGSSRLEMRFPLSLATGVNYRFSDYTSMAFDAQWTEWSQLSSQYTGGRSSPDNAFAFRLGGEHLFTGDLGNSVIACRGGAFYEPRPAWNDSLPVYGFSLGLGWTAKDCCSLDLAYQFRWGEGEFSSGDLEEFDYSIDEHWLISSIIWYF